MRNKYYFPLLIIFAFGCTSSEDTTPECETNATGEVFFSNESTTGKTYDIIWDGTKVATLAPNEESETFVVAANVPHVLQFRITGTGNDACTLSTPVIPQCKRMKYYCTG